MTTTAPIPIVSGSTSDTAGPEPAPRMRYGALIAMMTMSFLLVTAEFLPNGVLTEIADELRITPGQAGQLVTVTALVGLFVAPTVGLMFQRLDRRSLLVWLAASAAASNAIVAVVPNLPLMLLARVLLGAALSGFWAMSITVAARIAGPARVGRAVVFTTAGTSLATVAGVPVGVMLTEVLGWRGVFGIAAAATVLLAVALRLLLPSVPPEGAARLSVLVDTLRRPGISLGMVGHLLVVLGHFLAYTYIRLALERVHSDGAPIEAGVIVFLLALFGVGGLIGNVLIGAVVDRAYRPLAIISPLTIAATVILMIGGSELPWSIGMAAFLWGFFFSSWLLIVNTWVAHRVPDRLEAGGSLVVVGFQGAIMLAAGFGGILVDASSVALAYFCGAMMLVLGAVLFGISGRAGRR